jgi:hypothetical protein
MEDTMRNYLALGAAVLGVSAADGIRCRCGASTAYAEPTPTTEQDCPEFVRGARLSIRDVNGGVELKITTPWTVHLMPLRLMLHKLAVVVETYTRSPQAEADMEVPPSAVRVRDVASGVVIVVKPDNATNVPVLREQAKLLDEFWQASECINGVRGRMARR